jgi:hypothetical protein
MVPNLAVDAHLAVQEVGPVDADPERHALAASGAGGQRDRRR